MSFQTKVRVLSILDAVCAICLAVIAVRTSGIIQIASIVGVGIFVGDLVLGIIRITQILKAVQNQNIENEEDGE